jgi:hypothetical protein
LQATHIRVLLRDNVSTKKTLKLARRYSVASTSPDVWLARLDAENTSDECDIKSAWASARAAVDANSDVKGAEKIWLWGLDRCSTHPEDQQAVYEVNFSATSTILATDWPAVQLLGFAKAEHEELVHPAYTRDVTPPVCF